MCVPGAQAFFDPLVSPLQFCSLSVLSPLHANPLLPRLVRSIQDEDEEESDRSCPTALLLAATNGDVSIVRTLTEAMQPTSATALGRRASAKPDAYFAARALNLLAHLFGAVAPISVASVCCRHTITDTRPYICPCRPPLTPPRLRRTSAPPRTSPLSATPRTVSPRSSPPPAPSKRAAACRARRCVSAVPPRLSSRSPPAYASLRWPSLHARALSERRAPALAPLAVTQAGAVPRPARHRRQARPRCQHRFAGRRGPPGAWRRRQLGEEGRRRGRSGRLVRGGGKRRRRGEQRQQQRRRRQRRRRVAGALRWARTGAARPPLTPLERLRCVRPRPLAAAACGGSRPSCAAAGPAGERLTPLHYSSASQKLLDRALGHAAREGQAEAARCLLEAGARPGGYRCEHVRARASASAQTQQHTLRPSSCAFAKAQRSPLVARPQRHRADACALAPMTIYPVSLSVHPPNISVEQFHLYPLDAAAAAGHADCVAVIGQQARAGVDSPEVRANRRRRRRRRFRSTSCAKHRSRRLHHRATAQPPQEYGAALSFALWQAIAAPSLPAVQRLIDLARSGRERARRRPQEGGGDRLRCPWRVRPGSAAARGDIVPEVLRRRGERQCRRRGGRSAACAWGAAWGQGARRLERRRPNTRTACVPSSSLRPWGFIGRPPQPNGN